MAWMDVVNLHRLLTLFTIVILLAGLFFLYPAVSFNHSNNVMPPTASGKQGVQLPASHTLYSLLLFCWLVYSSCSQWYILANNVIPLGRRQGSPNLLLPVLCIPFCYPLLSFSFSFPFLIAKY